MRSVWKGFVVGAFTGAAVGLALEQADRARPGSTDAGSGRPRGSSRLRRLLAGGQVWKGLVVGGLTGAVVGAGVDLGDEARAGVIAAATVTGQAVRERGPRLAHRVTDSDAVHTVAGATRTAAQQAAGAAQVTARQAAGAAQTAARQAADSERLRAGRGWFARAARPA